MTRQTVTEHAQQGEPGLIPANRGILQRKLTIGASHDPLEYEADRVADQVMAASTHSSVNNVPLRIQRFSGQADGQMEVPDSVGHVLAGSGRPLEPTLKQDMEQRFGRDFSQVRVHSGGAAEQSALDVNANAYTVGHNIVFGAGQFTPGTHGGQRLLAHELTHVVQQKNNLALHTLRRQSKKENDLPWLWEEARYMTTKADNTLTVRYMQKVNLLLQKPDASNKLSLNKANICQKNRSAQAAEKNGGCINSKWNFIYDGCSLPEWLTTIAMIDKDNPTGGKNTAFALCKPSRQGGRACDRHDECYQTCGTQRTDCDKQMLVDMIKACKKSDSQEMASNCVYYAQKYYEGLLLFGGDPFRNRQKEVCDCPKRNRQPILKPSRQVQQSCRDGLGIQRQAKPQNEKPIAATTPTASKETLTLLPSTDPAKLSGKAWWDTNEKIAPLNNKSSDIADLESDFQGKVKEFKQALDDAGASISIDTTKRPKERAHVLHYAWQVAKGKVQAVSVPAMAGVDIVWDHGDATKSKAGAQEIITAASVASKPSLTSNHITGKAIDWTITWLDDLKVKKKDGIEQVIKTTPRNGGDPGNTELHGVGKGYGVIKGLNYKPKDPPHWSFNGK